MTGKIVTAKELSEYLKLSDSTVYKLASDGRLPALKIGDSWRFDLDDVLDFVKSEQGGRQPTSFRERGPRERVKKRAQSGFDRSVQQEREKDDGTPASDGTGEELISKNKASEPPG